LFSCHVNSSLYPRGVEMEVARAYSEKYICKEVEGTRPIMLMEVLSEL